MLQDGEQDPGPGVDPELLQQAGAVAGGEESAGGGDGEAHVREPGGERGPEGRVEIRVQAGGRGRLLEPDVERCLVTRTDRTGAGGIKQSERKRTKTFLVVHHEKLKKRKGRNHEPKMHAARATFATIRSTTYFFIVLP